MSHRIEKVNSLIREVISELLRREMRDPRLGELVTVTEVSTTPDLRHARVYVSHIGSEEEKRETLNSLNAASGFLRGELAKRLGLRRVPELSFEWDTSIEHGDRILRLIDKVSRPAQSEPGGGS